jgi:galactose-1-phosphate uridylyltransferase
VKTKEHREGLWQLTEGEAAELGPFLRTMSDAIVSGLGAERAYLTMWVDKPPYHVHMVVYPRWPSDRTKALDLQLERWEAGPPPEDEAAAAAAVLREYLTRKPA